MNNNKLNLWLQEVAKKCNEFANDIDLDFYPFQSPIPKTNIKLLIIAINPGGNKSYKEMLKEKSCFYDKAITARTIDMLAYDVNVYAEKPLWEIENNLKGNDSMRAKLKRVFTSEYLKVTLKNSTVMNMYYFNTKNTGILEKIDIKIKEFCIAKTKEFIEISNPDKILFFTTSDYELTKCGVHNIKAIGYYIKEGILNGKKVLAIPNPGFYRAYSYKNGELMGNIIDKYINS